MVSLRTAAMGAMGAALVCAVLGAAAWQHDGGSAPGLRLDANRWLGSPRSYRNLTLIPIYDRTARGNDSFLTLDEGLKAKQVSVKESKSGGDVNTLYVTNESKRPLYLMAGEVVLGGQQDRTLGRDTIVQPGAKEVPVTVFCVEHGRWTGRSEFDKSAPTVASAEIRSKAEEGQFLAEREAAGAQAATARPGAGRSSSSAPASNLARQAGDVALLAGRSEHVGKAQQQVWDKVARKNAKFGTESNTGSYRAALNLSGIGLKNVPAYVAALQNGLGNDRRLIGVVAAINGKVVAADVFGEPSLFRKLWPKLLRSYASDAVEQARTDGKPAPPATAEKAKEFLVAASDAKSKVENRSTVGTTVRYESSQAVSYSLMAAKKPAASPRAFAGSGFGGAVHTGVLGK